MKFATSASAALWSSGFRPFFLVGCLYSLLVMVVWLGTFAGHIAHPLQGLPLHVWHGHEMLFGFAGAIIAGVVLTALPSWAGTPEIRGTRLALLTGTWALGRFGFCLPGLPHPVSAGLDLVFFPLLLVMLAPQLLVARNRLYLLLLPILAALFAANLGFHVAMHAGDAPRMQLALHGAVYVVIVFFTLAGGVLTPIFTGNALREKNLGDTPHFSMPLETATLCTLVLLAMLDLLSAPALMIGISALACAVLHAWRVWRWKGWRVAGVPLVALMQLGFVWLILTLLLKAAGTLGTTVAPSAWVHAFTVGSLGMMMLGLMLRVSLRHTGRNLALPSLIPLACLLMLLAGVLRLAAPAVGFGVVGVAIAAVLWSVSVAIYLTRFAAILVRPSLPGRKAGR